MNLGRNEDAPSDYSKTIEIDPEYILAYNNGGINYFSNISCNIKEAYGRKEEALIHYSTAIEINP